MPLFRMDGKTVVALKEKPFKLEKEIQEICENNLDKLFGVDFIKSEFSAGKFRMDTIAFDKERNSFVIIEYKKRPCAGLIEQGGAYVSNMKKHKADFVLKYNEINKMNLTINHINWNNIRIIFVAPGFNGYQVEASEEAKKYLGYNLELYTIKRMSDDTIELEHINKNKSIGVDYEEDDNTSINYEEDKGTKADNQDKDNNDNKYTEKEHIDKVGQDIRELYEEVRNGIINIDSDIEVIPLLNWIAFKINNEYIASIFLQRKALQIIINLKKGELNDIMEISKDVSGKGHWSRGDYQIALRDTNMVEYVLKLIEQSYKKITVEE